MRRIVYFALTLALAGCSKSEPRNGSPQQLATYEVAPPSPGEPTAPAGPQISYSYTTTYTLAADQIAPLQAKHVALCRSLGAARCIVTKTNVSGSDADDGGSGSASLLVDARIAVAFGQRLDRLAGDGGGIVAAHSVEAEDVTKQVVDVDASVRAKQALADRLYQIIQRSSGDVGQLVEAEKAYADTQEALDAARGEQAALRQRVAMSQFDLTYESRAAGGALAPVRRSLSAAGDTLAISAAALVSFAVAAIPWVLLIALLVWIGRKRGWRLRRRTVAAPSE